MSHDLPSSSDACVAVAAQRQVQCGRGARPRGGRGAAPACVAAILTLLVLTAGCGAKENAASRPAKGAVIVEDLTAPNDDLALLSRYPQSPPLQSTRDTYAAAAVSGSRARDSIFMTTWFPTPDARVGEWSTIDARGRATIYRFVHDVGFQDSRTTSLVESQLPELQSLLATLPPSSPPPTLDRLLIIGYRRPEAGDWVTRLYDRAAPPESVRRIFREMTGAPL